VCHKFGRRIATDHHIIFTHGFYGTTQHVICQRRPGSCHWGGCPSFSRKAMDEELALKVPLGHCDECGHVLRNLKDIRIGLCTPCWDAQ